MSDINTITVGGTQYNIGGSGTGGSNITVNTSESSLYGQTVTLSDGTTTLTTTFNNNGVATFTGVTMTGNLTVSAGGASLGVSVPYYGNYSFIFSLFSATVTVTYPYTQGATCSLSDGTTTLIATGSPMSFNVPNTGTWTATVTLDGASKTDSAVITTDGQTASITIEYGTINVTYDNAFRGTTITCVQSGTTITKTAPSGANTMTFYPPTTGNWVISGTVSGTSYSKTANVTSLSTSVSVSLETVPDGKTTTPTDDIEKWLQCGQITGKSYTTLAEVLADAETYERLLSDSNACDYMKRSTTWALNEGEVPAMTSDTTPSGVCSASSVYSGREAYMAFDGDDTTSWTGNSTTATLKYEFPQAVTITRVKLYVASNNQTVVVEGSNDDIAYTPLVSSFTLVAGSDVYKDVSNPTSYKYYRLTVTALAGSYAWLHTVQFYGADITTSQDAMMRLGKYDYACDALLADSTWASAIANSTYFDSVLDVKVPTMTSNTTPSGEAFASTEREPAYYAFDGNDTTYYGNNQNALPCYVGYTFTSALKVAKVYIKPYYESSQPFIKDFIIQGSNDDFVSDVNDLYTGSFTTSETEKTVIFACDIPYTSYRLYVSTVYNSPGYCSIKTLQFYGRHTAQTDIIVTAHGGDTVYYMENGSPVTLTTADRDTGIGTVDWSDLPKGAITLYSSTAKNPSDLTADYSKTVYITEYTTQIYLMPENVLYWYGYESEIMGFGTPANGFNYYNQTSFTNPTKNYTNIVLCAQGSGYYTAYGTLSKISVSNLHLIGNYTGDTNYSKIEVYPDKTMNDSTRVAYLTPNTTMSYVHTNITSGSYYIMGTTANNNSRSLTIYALWYE